jgi:two-component system response regulator FixJ
MPELAKRVLLVDDDLAVRTSLKSALELEGLTARVYDSGPRSWRTRSLPGARAS